MKRIIINPDSKDQIFSSELKETDFIGVLYNECSRRGYITKIKGDKFILNDLASIDISDERVYQTQQDILEMTFVEEGFVFKTHKELINWLNGAN